MTETLSTLPPWFIRIPTTWNASKTEIVFDLSSFTRALATALGVDPDTQGELDSCEPVHSRFRTFTLDGFRVTVSPMHGANRGRVHITAYAPRELHEASRSLGRLQWPDISADSARPVDKIAADIRRKLAPDAASMLAQCQAVAKKEEENRKALASVIADLSARFLHVAIQPDSSGETATVSLNSLAGGGYLNATLNADGSLYVRNMNTLKGDQLAALFALLGPADPIKRWNVECREQGAIGAFAYRQFLASTREEAMNAAHRMGLEVNHVAPVKAKK